jgi:hypothetical protein
MQTMCFLISEIPNETADERRYTPIGAINYSPGRSDVVIPAEARIQ